MENQKLGRQTFQPGSPPVIIGFGSAAGKKESQGPLGRHFDHTCQDDAFGAKTWEQAESAMQGLALDAALKRAGLHTPDLDLLLAGDLLNQCIGAGYAARAAAVPEPMHWFKRSPASSRSRSGLWSPARFSAASSASCCMADSDFSQVSSPKASSWQVWSKWRPKGPSASFFPAAEPYPMMTGGDPGWKVCRPSF